MTLDEIKQTPLFLAYRDKVENIWPGRSDDFARELLLAHEHYKGVSRWEFQLNQEGLRHAFNWDSTPQGDDAWGDFYCAVHES